MVRVELSWLFLITVDRGRSEDLACLARWSAGALLLLGRRWCLSLGRFAFALGDGLGPAFQFQPEPLGLRLILAAELAYRGDRYLDALLLKQFGYLFITGVLRAQKQDGVLIG
jgi:hypothetical protein